MSIYAFLIKVSRKLIVMNKVQRHKTQINIFKMEFFFDLGLKFSLS